MLAYQTKRLWHNKTFLMSEISSTYSILYRVTVAAYCIGGRGAFTDTWRGSLSTCTPHLIFTSPTTQNFRSSTFTVRGEILRSYHTSLLPFYLFQNLLSTFYFESIFFFMRRHFRVFLLIVRKTFRQGSDHS